MEKSNHSHGQVLHLQKHGNRQRSQGKIGELRLFLSALVIVVAFLGAGCSESPMTFAVHDPIYPAVNQDVVYNLEVVSGTNPTSIELFETVSNLDGSGNVTSTGSETSLNTWSSPGGSVSFTKTGGYSANRLVNYRFVVKAPNSSGSGCSSGTVTYTHDITYAIRPYPASDEAAPVYLVGDPDDVFDIVFIPDTDITNMTTFRDHCRLMIRDAFFDEPTTRKFRRSFNFYINPDMGTATDYDRISIDGLHMTPANYANITFAEGRVLLHQNNLRDYASGGLYSAEMQNRGTILHESGHGLFGLADEYQGGSHWMADPYPNNWDSETDAQADAPSRGKTAADVVKIGSDAWWKMCPDDCQLKATGLNHTFYDEPCEDRVIWAVLDNAIN